MKQASELKVGDTVKIAFAGERKILFIDQHTDDYGSPYMDVTYESHSLKEGLHQYYRPDELVEVLSSAETETMIEELKNVRAKLTEHFVNETRPTNEEYVNMWAALDRTMTKLTS